MELLFALLPLPGSFRMSQQKSMTEFVVFMELILGSPEYWDVIVNPRILGFFEWGCGDPSCFLFLTTVVEDGGCIARGLPEYFLLDTGEGIGAGVGDTHGDGGGGGDMVVEGAGPVETGDVQRLDDAGVII